ncbi:hypothetical protein SHIRM173S_12095 [Streptomyces hirsutus]
MSADRGRAPLALSASRFVYAVEPAAVQISRSASVGPYPLTGEVFGARTCCPVVKYGAENATSSRRSQLIVMVRTIMSTRPSWIAGMRWSVGIALNWTAFRSPSMSSAMRCARSMSKPSSRALSPLLGSR